MESLLGFDLLQKRRNLWGRNHDQTIILLQPVRVVVRKEFHGVRSRTPSPVPSNASSQQTPSWVRPSTVASSMYSQQKASWARPSAKEQTPSPAQSTADSTTTSQQTPSWVRPQRTSSPVPSNVSDASQPQKAPWARPQRTPSPVPSNASDTSRQKAPWVRPSSTEQTNSIVANGYSQKRTSWARSSPTSNAQTPSSPVSQKLESENAPEARAHASPKRSGESFVQRRMRSVKMKEMERQASESSLSVGVRDEKQKTLPFGVYSPKSPTKKWPPVRAQPFANGYRQQHAVEQTVEPENSLTNSSKVEEQPADTLSDNQGSVTPTSHDEAKASAVRKAPWLRTSPPAPTSNDSRPRAREPAPVEQADPTPSRRAKSWDRQTPSPVPTDERNHQSSWAQSAARLRSSLNDNERSIPQRTVPRPYKKPPPSPLFVNNTTKYVPPWVKARDAEAELNSNVLESEPPPIDNNIDTAPSDEVIITSPPPVRSDRKQSTTSPLSPGRNEILNEVKTRKVPLNDNDDWREGQVSDEIAEVVVSYGGAVIETPKSVNVASLGASFASGERFSPPPKSKSPRKIGYGASPPSTNRHLSKQSASPDDPSPDQSERPSWTAGHVSPEKPKRGQWNKVHSPPPAWSKPGHSSKPQGSQRDLGTIQSPKYAAKPPIGRTAPAQTPPPTWIKKQDVSQGDLSSIKSPRWGQPKTSQSPQGSVSVPRSQPPSLVNRNASPGDMSSIKSHDWSSRPNPVRGSTSSYHPPSWIERDAVEDELSPIASPEPSPHQRKVRITVETVDDDESDDYEVADRQWSPESQTAEFVYAAEEGAASGSNYAAAEPVSRSRGDYEDEDVDSNEELDGQYPQKSPTISLAQMAMDSAFALDFDLVMAQARKPVLLEDDEDSFGSSPSKGMAKSTPPERELPDEVKAMLERSLNRSTMSDSGIHEDSAAYEADYVNTDVSNNAMDQTESTWNENDISALSHDSALEPLSPPMNDKKSLEPSPQTNRALHFSTDESPVKAEESNEVTNETLERIREMKLNDNDPADDKSEAGSSSSEGLEQRDLYGGTNSAEERSPRITERVVAGWCGGRVPSPRRQEEPSSKTRGVASFTNFGPNESTIDLGNPTDFSIQVSPDSPRQASLVGTSPALVSDSPPEDFADRKTVRFDGPDESNGADDGFGNEPLQSVRQFMEEWRHEKKAIEDSLPPPPPILDDEGTSPPSSAGAVEVLKYFTRETPPEVNASGMNDSEQWYQQDSGIGDMTPNPVQAETINGAKWRQRNGITASLGKSTKLSSGFGDQDPFSKQDAQDPFFRQDDPFAASKSASSDFASDFGEGFNPFADDPETNEAFDFEKEVQQEYFSPYGDAPKSTTTTTTRSRTSTPTRLTPSRRDVRRRSISTGQYLDDEFYNISTQQPQVTTTTTTRYEQSPPPPREEEDDEFVEYYAQQAAYVPTASAEIGAKEGTYLLEI